MPTNLIENTINMNYLYTALATCLTKDPSILRNGITNETPIVQSIGHSGWDDFKNDGLRYIFFFNFKLTDWLIGTLETVVNCEIINNDKIQHNYQCPLMKTVDGKRVPITYNDILKDPLSRTVYSKLSGYAGNSLYDFAIAGKTAHVQIISQCPVDVRLIRYNHPVYYEITYNLVTSTGEVTIKKSIVGIIKYRKVNGEENIVYFGTAIEEFIVDQPTT
jgi:hypothetical protein